jgi:hypothetical protein
VWLEAVADLKGGGLHEGAQACSVIACTSVGHMITLICVYLLLYARISNSILCSIFILKLNTFNPDYLTGDLGPLCRLKPKITTGWKLAMTVEILSAKFC